MLNGENDSETPVQQAFLLQQRLTEVNHLDHTLITYPNLGHFFYPSSQWFTGIGPIQQYVLADLYAWLEAHSGLSPSSVTTTSTIGASTSSLNTNTTVGLCLNDDTYRNSQMCLVTGPNQDIAIKLIKRMKI